MKPKRAIHHREHRELIEIIIFQTIKIFRCARCGF